MFPEVTTDAIKGIAQSSADQFSVDILDIEIRKRGDAEVIILTVDSDEAIDIDVLTDLSESISLSFDEAQVLDGRSYELEVSTPGIDRPLTHPRQWIRNRGRLVKVLIAGNELLGRIGLYDSGAEGEQESVILVVPPQRLKGQPVSAKSLEIFRIRLADIESAVVQVEFKPLRGADVDAALDDAIGERAQQYPSEANS